MHTSLSLDSEIMTYPMVEDFGNLAKKFFNLDWKTRSHYSEGILYSALGYMVAAFVWPNDVPFPDFTRGAIEEIRVKNESHYAADQHPVQSILNTQFLITLKNSELAGERNTLILLRQKPNPDAFDQQQMDEAQRRMTRIEDEIRALRNRSVPR